MTIKSKKEIELKQDQRKTKMSLGSIIINKMGIYFVVFLLLIIGLILRREKFVSLGNIRSIMSAVSLTGMCCAGLGFVVYSANFNDMSLPMTIALSGMVSVQFIPFGIVISLFAGVITGTLIGIVNGIMIGKFRANPIIWSLAFNLVLSGVATVAWGGKQVYPDVMAGSSEVGQRAAEIFNSLARTYFVNNSIPLMVIVMILLITIAQFILVRTRFGNQLKIVGSNYEVARLSGINCVKMIVIAYICCAFCTSICGIFYTSLTKTGAYSNGEGYDFSCLTSVLLGGMTQAGGKGNMIGVFGGVLAVGMLMNIMTLIGVSTFEQWLVQGIVFLFIVWINTYSGRKLGRV